MDHGGIARKELERFLVQGAQWFIQLVRVRPAFRHGRFFGWRILAYHGPGPIHTGDIVKQVNGRPVERPEQFMAVWQHLGRASELVVALHRDGKATTLRYPIID